jgi:fibronectin-binding autotransporter adhesin
MRAKALSGSIAKYSRGLALSVLTLIGASQAPGAIYYWDNTGGTLNDWGSLPNWSTVLAGGTTPGVLPGTADVVTFSASPIFGTNQTVNLNDNRSVLGLEFLSGVTATTTLLGGGTNRTLTIGLSGITSAASNTVTIGSSTNGQNVAIIVAGSQSWANNGTGTVLILNSVSGTGSPTLTNNGTGSGQVALAGSWDSSVTKIVQDSATSQLALRNGFSANTFAGIVEIKKGTVSIGNGATNLGTGVGGNKVILGNSAGGSNAATLTVGDNSNQSFATPIELAANTTGLLKIRLTEDSTTASHSKTFTGGITGSNSLTIENNGGTGSNADTITFSANQLDFTGSLTHIGTGNGASTISSVIGSSVTGVTQNSATSTMVLSGANTFNGTTRILAGILSLGNSSALQNSALDTTSSIAGSPTQGLRTTVTTLTLGGLIGSKAFDDIAGSVFTTTSGGYGSVTALTLNPLTGVSVSYSGAIGNGAATTSLTKTGAGTQTFTGTNSYTGATSVNAGTLVLGFGGVASNIISSSSALTMGGGTLQLTGTGTQTFNGLTTTASTSSRIVLNANETLTLGALTSAGAGSALNFNTAAGGADAGTTTIGTSIVTMTGGTLLNTWTVTDSTGFGLATRNVSNQVIRDTATTLLPATGGVVGTDYLVNNNAGGGGAAGSSTLAVTASESARSITVDTTAASGVLTLNSTVVLSNSIWNFGGTNSNTYQITGSAGGAGLRTGATAETFVINNYNTGTVTFTSPIVAFGANPLTVNGTGTTRLASVANTYIGVTTVTGGTLEVVRLDNGSVNSSIGNPGNTLATNLLLGSGATLRFVGDGSVNDTTDRNWTLNGASNGDSATLDASGAGTERVTFSSTASPAYGTNNQTRTINLAGTNTSANTLAANIANNGTGAVSLTKSGVGTWVLTGNSSFTGSTTISNGILEVTANNALGSNAAGTTVANGATLKLTGVNYATTEALSINGTGVGGGGALLNSGTSTFAGLITALTNATINAGGGVLNLTGGLVKDGTTLTFTGGGSINISSVISGASANSDVIVDGTTVTETGVNNTYNGPTIIQNGGTLNANALGALPLTPRSAVSFIGTGNSLNLGANQVVASLSSAGAATVALGSNTLTIGITGGNTTFAGSIGGTNGNLIKDTNSKQVLSGANGYTGTTTVSAGTLEVTGSLSGTTAVTVSTGGTLLMNGASNNVGTGDRAPVASSQTISGSVAGANFTGSGGTLAVATGASGLNHSFNQMTLTANSTLDFSSGTGTTNTNVNMIFASLNGATKTALTGTPTLTLTIANWSGPQYSPGDTVDSSPTGFGDGRDRLIFTSDPGFGLGSFIAGINFTGFGAGATQVAFGSNFEIVPVPEPATTALIGSIALCALIGYRERRRFTGFGKRMAARK